LSAAERAPPIVLDASAVIPWFVAEDATPAAERLLHTDRPLLAPRIILTEIANALLTRQRRGQLPRGQAEEALTLLAKMRAGVVSPALALFDEHEVLFFMRAVALAESLAHPLYDCFYLVLAKREAAALATFDRRLSQLARTLAIPLWATDDAR
jgi:predicted nucleic acid-binding protein